jgi:hypothetical protein
MALFDEILVKMAQGDKLTPSELEELRQAARALDETKNAVKGWLQSGSSDPKFGQMRADSGRFTVAPIGTLYLEVFGDVPQTIANDTETAVLFDTVAGASPTLRWDIAEQTKIYALSPGKRYAFIGVAQWEANASGRRAAHINAYDESGVHQWGQTLHSLKPEGTESDTMPFAQGLVGDTFERAYFQVTVYQNSGSDLDLEYFSFTIFEII